MFCQPDPLGGQPFTIIIAPRRQSIPNKIRNPKLEIGNKPKDLNPNYEFQNPKRACLEFCVF
jgi:hypothetical protein